VRLRALVTHVRLGWQRHAQVVDLGLGGARFVIDELLEVGEIVTLSFVAPTLWDPLVLRARVAWVALDEAPARRVGVAFDHKSATAALALFELVATTSYE
jgi:hypothetical protein